MSVNGERPPSVDKVARAMSDRFDSARVRTAAARSAVETARSEGILTFVEIVSLAESMAETLQTPHVRQVINMSGVILHTGLGRARLSTDAATALGALDQHVLVELDPVTGERGDRQEAVRGSLCKLTGSESALVVNNCAAALFLTLTSLCRGGGVVLSRGQMVEIGGSFRLPEIVKSSGCELTEVGCTNKTRLSDYEQAVNEDTVAFLRCHPSNFKIVGFVEEPTASSLSQLARKRDLLMIDDVGSGCLVDTIRYGLPAERTLQDAVRDGADIVLASGDKLLGGPQAGLILGREDLINTIAAHPLARAVRVDKGTLAALEATLRAYQDRREETLPIWRYAGRPQDEVKAQAERLASAYPAEAVVESGLTEMGGGSMPGSGIATWRVGLASKSADELMAWLRNRPVPVIARIERGKVWLDPRTCETEEVAQVEEYLRETDL